MQYCCGAVAAKVTVQLLLQYSYCHSTVTVQCSAVLLQCSTVTVVPWAEPHVGTRALALLLDRLCFGLEIWLPAVGRKMFATIVPVVMLRFCEGHMKGP